MALRYAADERSRFESGLRNADYDPSMPQQDSPALDSDFELNSGQEQSSIDLGHRSDPLHEQDDFTMLFGLDPRTAYMHSAETAVPFSSDLDPASNPFAIKDESPCESSQSESSTESFKRRKSNRGSAVSLCSLGAKVPLSNNGTPATMIMHQMGNLGMESTVASRNPSLSVSPDSQLHGLPGVTIPNFTSQDTMDSNVRDLFWECRPPEWLEGLTR